MKKILFVISFSLAFNSFHCQFQEQWHTTINGQGDYSDRYTCIVQDDAGNIYVGGSTMNPNHNSDFLVAKYSSSGSLQWLKTWNGLGDGPDEANAIAINGNQIIVAGYINNPFVGNDYFTIALDQNGDSLWASTYNDSQYNQYDQINAIAIDGVGNIIVTGESDRDPTNVSNDDFLTVKYNSSGSLLWTKRFNNVGNATDRAVAVVTDTNNNIYVAGRTDNGNDDDYAIIKYDEAGNVVWTQFVDNGGTDRATAMGIDASNNVYVTGRSSNGNDDDFRTVKISPSGLTLWNMTYDFVEDDRADYISVNANGDVSVAGRSDANATLTVNYNFRVVTYNSNGQQQWTATYDGAGSNDDIVRGVTLSDNGTVYVTGYADADPTGNIQNDIVSIRYDGSNAAIWTKVYAGTGLNNDESNACLIASNGNLTIAAQSENTSGQRNALLLQYDSSGNVSLDQQYNGFGDNSENVRALITDASGNIYVAGYMVSKDTDRNMFVCKINQTGDTLWTNQFSGTLIGSDDEANCIALNTDGSVVIGGYAKNNGSSSDIIVRKFSTNGQLLWSTSYNGVANESDRAYDIVTDASGNVYITGKTDINPSPIVANDQVITIKYNANGVQQWAMTYDGGTGLDRGKFIKLSPSGSIYVGGKRSINGQDDYLIIKYNANGQQMWANSYDNAGGNDEPNDMELDVNENIYLTGGSETTLGSAIHDFFTLGVDAQGNEIFSSLYAGDAGGDDVAEALSIVSGYICIAGYSDVVSEDGNSNDCVTICYESNGQTAWLASYDGSGTDDIADDISIDANGIVGVICHSNTAIAPSIQYDLHVMAYDITDGNLIQETVFNLSDSMDVANVMLNETGSVYLGGSTWSVEGQRDILVVKYNLTVGIEEVSSFDFELFPEPCQDFIHVSVSGTDKYSMSIFDLTGNEVSSGTVFPGLNRIDLSGISGGQYLLRLNNNKESVTRKIIKL